MRDLEIIHDELLLKDLQVANTALDAAKKMVDRGSGGKEKKDEYVSAALRCSAKDPRRGAVGSWPPCACSQEFLVKLHEHLEAKRDVRAGMWTGTEVRARH